LLHEALRKLKIHDNAEISERVLQELTAKIMLQNPLPGETLDSESVLGVPVIDFKRSAFPLTVLCDRLKSFQNELPLSQIAAVTKAQCGNSPKLQVSLLNRDYISERATRIRNIEDTLVLARAQIVKGLTARSIAKLDELYLFIQYISSQSLAGWSNGYSPEVSFLVPYLPEERQSHWPDPWTNKPRQ
ncbi:MAG: hypothetical protein K2X47_03675, partial [Bdellovibrionales bacterium]|nr:hypothetical protein [Bdellovibrionales bacterium]